MERYRSGQKICKTVIAVDIDGVLADHVDPILNMYKSTTGINISKNEIVNCQCNIGNNSIRNEIRKAQKNESFISQMRPINNAPEALRAISQKHDIVIVTGRDTNTDDWNCIWLKKYGIPCKKYMNASIAGKIVPGASVLIDDHAGNINSFLKNHDSKSWAILFSQPWSQDIQCIEGFMNEGRVEILSDWIAIPALLKRHTSAI